MTDRASRYPAPHAAPKAGVGMEIDLVYEGEDVLGLDLRLVCDLGLDEMCANNRTPDERPTQFSDGGDLSVAYRALVSIAKDAGWSRSEDSGLTICPSCQTRQKLDEVAARAKVCR